MSSEKKSEVYSCHQMALRPLVLNSPPSNGNGRLILLKMSEENRQIFLEFIVQQGLAGFWFIYLKSIEKQYQIPRDFMVCLKENLYNQSINYLAQKKQLNSIYAFLNEEKISHAIIKGTHIRELIYPTPAARQAVDIDILIHEKDKIKTIKLFEKEGFTVHVCADNLTHEVSLLKGSASIDLHWHVFRPARSRIQLTKKFLKSRKIYSDHWGLGLEENLFIMLVHPIFTKYLTTPHATLDRVLDIVSLIQNQGVDWHFFKNLLSQSGLKTAAWVNLEYINLLTDVTAPREFVNSIKPGIMRRKYFEFWMENNLSTRYLEYPLIPQFFFTLLAHDSIKDIGRVIFALVRERKERNQAVRMFDIELRV